MSYLIESAPGTRLVRGNFSDFSYQGDAHLTRQQINSGWLVAKNAIEALQNFNAFSTPTSLFACELHKYAFFSRSYFIHYASLVYDKNVRFYTCFFCPRTCENQWIRRVDISPTPRPQAFPAPARSGFSHLVLPPDAKRTCRTKDRSAWSLPR